MKLFLLVACFVALATARSMGSGGGDRDNGQGKKGPNPIKGLVKLCMKLAEDAAADDTKRSWEDVFGQLAPVCEALFEELEDTEKPKPSGPPPKNETGDETDKRGKGRNYRRGSGDDDVNSGGDDAGNSGGDNAGNSGGDDAGNSGGDNARNSGGDDDGNSGGDNAGNSGGDNAGNSGGDGKSGQKGSKGKDSGDGRGPKPSGPPPSGAPMKYWMDQRGMGGDKEINDTEVLLKICERLAKMAEKEEEEGNSKKSIEGILESMKAVCDAAFAQAEEDAGN